MVDYRLPEPSGDILFKNYTNSYGGVGVYYVGKTEIECPSEDVEYHAQMLADSLAALGFENRERVDSLAAEARNIYYGHPKDMRTWDKLSDDFRDRWRAAVRVVLDAR